jgi:hypothetical protein
METKKITLKDLKKYFTETIYNSLPLNYPQLNKNMAALVFDKEYMDKTFIPGSLPAHVRAELAVFDFGGYKYDTTEELYNAKKLKGKLLLLAEKIVLAHRKAEHTDTDSVATIDARNVSIDTTMKKESVEFTDYENQLIAAAETSGFWML